jgi:hypothetical protein
MIPMNLIGFALKIYSTGVTLIEGTLTVTIDNATEKNYYKKIFTLSFKKILQVFHNMWQRCVKLTKNILRKYNLFMLAITNVVT